MEIILEKESKIAKLKVSLKEADYRPKVAEKVKEYSKKASIKGFRPGKVPSSLIDRMYGKSILVDEINHLVSHSISDYIKSNKLNIVGEPLPAEENNKVDWDNQKEFEFQFNIGLVPDFSVNLDQLNETRHIINVDDKILNETIENLKSQFGEMIDVDSIGENDDFIVGELKEVNGDFFKEGSSFTLSRIKESERSKFLGKKKDETITVDLHTAFEDIHAISVTTGLSKEEAETKTGEFQFTIKNIRRKKLAEINQEFYDKVFGKETVKSDEEFREKLKATIQDNYLRETEALLSRDIEEHLVKNTEISIPSDFLKDWLYKSNNGKFSQEDIEKQFDRFSEDLKWNLIKNKIAEENNLKAEHEEIMAKAKEGILQQFGGSIPMTPEMDETLNKIADNYLKQDNGKAYMQTYEGVLVEKTLSFIKTKIKVEEKSVSLDEFKQVAGFQG